MKNHKFINTILSKRILFKYRLLILNMLLVAIPVALLGSIFINILLMGLKESEVRLTSESNAQIMQHIDTFWSNFLSSTQMMYINSDLQNSLTHINKDFSEVVSNVRNIRKITTQFNDQFRISDIKSSYYFGGTIVSTIYSMNETLTTYQSSVLSYDEIKESNIVKELETTRFVFELEEKTPGVSVINVYQKLLDFNTTEEIGVLKIEVPIMFIQNLLSVNSDNSNHNVYYITQSNQMITSSEAFSLNEGEFEKIVFDAQQSNEYFFASSLSEVNNYQLITIKDERQTLVKVVEAFKFYILIIFVCLVIGAVIGLIFEKILYRRIQWLFDNIAANNDLQLKTAVSNDEFDILNLSFQNMIKKIELLTAQKYEVETKVKSIQLELLQDSINPHLLYNTLANLSYRLNQSGSHEESSLVKRVSIFYKYMLNSDENIITLEKEISLLENYICIISSMYNMHVETHINLNRDLYDYKINKMLLQPLVENSLLHGMRANQGGAIKIQVVKSDDEITITIEDDGIGINADTLYKIENDLLETSYAVKNIKKRLHFYYDSKASLHFTSENNTTTATIKLPYFS